ncbi:MAG: ROK family protein [Candidatus Omnitrophica bacterium]|nr:ROK family protein [Candidatus Omnitrophota bacterium]
MEKKYAIGIGFNLFGGQAHLLREDGKIIATVQKKRKFVDANETIGVLLSLFEEIVKKSAKYKDGIIGVGLALGGIVNKKKGVVYWPQKQNDSCVYISLPFKQYLEDKFKLPIFIENDANASAFAEYKLNYSSYKNLIYMFSGVGCGIIIEGKLYRGKDGGAGELFVNPQRVMVSSLGEFIFLSQWPQDLGVVKRAKELISLGKDTSLIRRVDSVGNLSLESIVEEAKEKDRISREILKEAAFPLGVKIAFLINFLNPEVVIIGGGFEEAGNFFLEEILKTIRIFSFSALSKNLKINFSSLGRNAASLGVAHLIFEEKSLHS